jgi:peptide-methionine (S)-S-oxide reductase
MRFFALTLTLIFSVFTGTASIAANTPTAQATFAGGCFWCMEPAFAKIAGVEKVTVGYTGGHVANPTYEQVSAGGTGHVEAIQVVYNPNKVPYQALLDIFWKNVDPTDATGQFCDKGEHYRAGIFTHTPEQATLAEASKQKIAEQFAPTPVATFIKPASIFYAAEDYHQAFYLKNPNRYERYSKGCGREQRLEELQGR